MNFSARTKFGGTISLLLAALILMPWPASAQSASAGDGFNVTLPVQNGEEPQQPGSGSGQVIDRSAPQITNLIVEADIYSAVFIWQTSKDTVGQLSWGNTPDMADGNLQERLYTKLHQTKLADLQPGKIYFYSLRVQDGFGGENLRTGTFQTLSLADVQPPANVSDFRADVADKNVRLSWANPSDPDFSSIRLVRSDKFYPLDPFNGQVIFEGFGISYLDQSVRENVVYYYSIFAKDNTGNYSSGALATATIKTGGAPGVEPEQPEPGQPSASPYLPLSILDFSFYQNGQQISFSKDFVPLFIQDDLLIALDGNKVSEPLRNMVVEIFGTRGNNWKSTYLFSWDKRLNRYAAVIPGFVRDGTFSIQIVPLDFRNEPLQIIPTDLIVTAPDGYQAKPKIQADDLLLLLSLLIVILLAFLLLEYWKRKRDQNTT